MSHTALGEDCSPDPARFGEVPSTFTDVNASELSRTVEQLRKTAEATVVLCQQIQADIAATPANPVVQLERPMLLDRAQVAKLLGVSVSTLWRWRQENVIPTPIAIGSMERWRRVDIEAFIDSQASDVA